MAVKRSLLLSLTVLLNVLILGWCQSFEECAEQRQCGNCINLGRGGCAWCSQEGFAPARCQPLQNLTSTTCSGNAIQNPSSSAEEPTPREGTDDVLSPLNISNIQLNLRVGDPQTFRVFVTPQRNLPLDLYILIDLSASMNTELNALGGIASQISSRVVNVTNNVRLGFGSFNDKTITPFTLTPLIPEPPIVNDETYAFRHIIDFTEDNDAFEATILSLSTTSNVDPPENGFEGLAQVLTCQDIVGWREETRDEGSRVVLFVTDNGFHFAGEGVLGGIINPYNGTCLLNPDGSFTAQSVVDYPSMGQILELLTEYSVSLIFAIDPSNIGVYENLADTIFNINARRAVYAPFDADPNVDIGISARVILDLIEAEYRRILQVVSLDFGQVSTDVSIDVQAICPEGANITMTNDSCSEVELESTVAFDVTVTLNSCEGLEHKQPIDHIVSSPSFGTFTLTLNPICNCLCAENEGLPGLCNNNGIPRCGVCECFDGYCGDACDIPIGDRNALDCPTNSDGVRCSGRGTCDCNCVCDQPPDFPENMVFGDACQCDTFSCLRPGDEQICSGRGECCEGVCNCTTSPRGNLYRGDNLRQSCQCQPEEEVCRDPNNPDVLCNGRGTCGCDFCDCTDSMYTGIFCDTLIVATCDHPDDIECIAMCRGEFDNEVNLPDICPNECARNRPLLFVDREENTGGTALGRIANERLNATTLDAEFNSLSLLCEASIEGCPNEYYLLRNETHFAIVVVRELGECIGTAFPIPLWSLAPIILGGLLILGILIIILLKIIFVILDYLEVKRWERDARTADFSKNTNPLYQSPEMKYENVAYGRE